jgi:hypothetical protein
MRQMELLDVAEHIVLDGALHGGGYAILILNASISTITRMAGHFLAKLFIQFGQSLVLLGLLRLRLRRCLFLCLVLSDVDAGESNWCNLRFVYLSELRRT